MCIFSSLSPPGCSLPATLLELKVKVFGLDLDFQGFFTHVTGICKHFVSFLLKKKCLFQHSFSYPYPRTLYLFSHFTLHLPASSMDRYFCILCRTVERPSLDLGSAACWLCTLGQATNLQKLLSFMGTIQIQMHTIFELGGIMYIMNNLKFLNICGITWII